MLRWIIALSVVCVTSAVAGFRFIPFSSPVNGLCLTIFAVSGVMLISALDALETSAMASDRDER